MLTAGMHKRDVSCFGELTFDTKNKPRYTDGNYSVVQGMGAECIISNVVTELFEGFK